LYLIDSASPGRSYRSDLESRKDDGRRGGITHYGVVRDGDKMLDGRKRDAYVAARMN